MNVTISRGLARWVATVVLGAALSLGAGCGNSESLYLDSDGRCMSFFRSWLLGLTVNSEREPSTECGHATTGDAGADGDTREGVGP